MFKGKLLLGILALICSQIKAQDVHFSQYFTSPLTLNPANTGLVNSDWRLSGNYRSQWGAIATPYETTSFSIDGSFFREQLDNGDAVGVGVMYLNDKSGIGNLVNGTTGISLAYHHALGDLKNQHLSVGVQTYLVTKGINFHSLTFGDMFNPITGRAEIGTHEDPKLLDVGYSDFNAGVMYSGNITEYSSIYGGMAVYHITRPNESFLGSSNKINSRFSTYLGGSFELTDFTTCHVSANFQKQGPQSELVLGGAMGFILNPLHRDDIKNTILYLGSWMRVGDALIPYIGFEVERCTFGLSYDATTSKLSTANNYNGAFELSMIYNGFYPHAKEKPRYNFSCPKF